MHHTLFRFTPNIRNDIYLKDPTSSLLGNNLMRHSIDLIDEVGLEEFNFKAGSKNRYNRGNHLPIF